MSFLPRDFVTFSFVSLPMTIMESAKLYNRFKFLSMSLLGFS